MEFGWPSDATSMPVWLSAGPDGFADIDGVQAVRISLALAAVVARARRPLDQPASELAGALPGDARFVVSDLPRGRA
jgi:hypothetical protein